jgi:hypothetical protein
MRPRSQRGAPCGAWCTQATAVEGRGGHRPRPGRSKANGRLGRCRGTGRGRTVGQQLGVPSTVQVPAEAGSIHVDERTGMTVGPAEAGPGVRSRRSRTSYRPRPEIGTGSPCLDAGEGRQAPAPNGTGTTSLPRGGGRSRLPHRRVPRRNARGRSGGAGTDAVSNSRRSGERTGAKDPARERRCRTQGAVRAQSPEGGRNLLAC